MTTIIPIFRRAEAKRIAALSRRTVPLGREAATAAFPENDGLDIYIVRIGEEPIPAAELDGEQVVPGKLRLPVYRIPYDEDEVLEAATSQTSDPETPDELKFWVYNLQFQDSPTDLFGLAVQERMTGRLIFVASIGEECLCDAVHELRIDNSPSGGTVSLTYTIDGTTGSSASVAYNSTASSAASAIIAANSAKLTSDNFKAYGGPLPMVALYFRFTDNLAGMTVHLPTISNGLTGTNVIPKYGHFTAPGWS